MHAEKSLYSELLSKARAIDLAFIVSLAWRFLKVELVLIENSSFGYQTQCSWQPKMPVSFFFFF